MHKHDVFLKRIETSIAQPNPNNPKKKWGHKIHKLIFTAVKNDEPVQEHTYVDKFNQNYSDWEPVMRDFRRHSKCWIFCQDMVYKDEFKNLLDADHAPSRYSIYDPETGLKKPTFNPPDNNFSDFFDIDNKE